MQEAMQRRALASTVKAEALEEAISTKVVNSVSVGVLFFQLEWNVSISKCFGVPFRGCTVHIYIYIEQT